MRDLSPQVTAVQDRLRAIEWLRPLPGHFLHVTLADSRSIDQRAPVSELLERGRKALRGLPSFRLSFPRLNCFHEAVVAEAEGDGAQEAAQRLRGRVDFYLPHLSLAYTTARGAPGELRDALVPIRETDVGEQNVRELQLCVVPASRRTILRPWAVAGAVTLD